jgi:hypothetical protein
MRRMCAALALTSALAATACGNQEPVVLSGDRAAEVATANLVFAFVCLDGSRLDEVPESVRTLIDVMRADPEAIYETPSRERTMREVVADAASTIDSCEPAYASELDRALSATD